MSDDATIYHCSRCGTLRPSGSNFCPKCGQAFSQHIPDFSVQSDSIPSRSIPTVGKVDSFGEVRLKVNFTWIGEAWEIILSDLPIFVSATFAQVIMPALMLFATVWTLGFIVNYIYPDSYAYSDPVRDGLHFIITLPCLVLSMMYYSRINKATLVMINKKISGGTIHMGDYYIGDWKIWGLFFLNLIFVAIIYVCSYASAAFYFPILFIFPLFALCLPVPAMVADDYSLLEALQRSFHAIKGDLLNASLLLVTLYLILAVSGLFFGLGLLVTIPMMMVISSLAYRDLFKSKADQHISNEEAIQTEMQPEQATPTTMQPDQESNHTSSVVQPQSMLTQKKRGGLLYAAVVGAIIISIFIYLAGSNNSIYGKWYTQNGTCVEFQTDGTSIVSIPDQDGNLSVNPPDTGHFTIDGNTLTEETSSGPNRLNYEISSGTLTMREADTGQLLGIYTRTSPK